MIFRSTPLNDTDYWRVTNSQENLLLQENGLMPMYMDREATYYKIDKKFVDKYMKLSETHGILQERRVEFVGNKTD